ncbi:MAG: peptidoglycan DD-metalloendopeptidase family protein, partial [Proteobacteria bacterium]|nr:peptidoglycan DD-metalloendopeptidase family protein [Pseudomonadota bacterium]
EIGPLEALPGMEGKAMLFKEFGGVDAWPICLDTKDTEEIIKTVKYLAPAFGGINLEDISAPRCFEIEARLKGLSRREAELTGALHGRKTAQSATLGALMRLSRQPPQALIATPTAIDDAIRTSLLLRSTAGLLEEQANSLGAALEELNALHRRIASQRMELDGATAGLAKERGRLEALLTRALARRRDADDQRILAAARAARLADEAETLTDLSGAVLALSEGGAARFRPGRPFSAARGSLPMPARGRLIGLFGEGGGERKNKGIIIETRDDAQVITPYDGEVVYAGPFRGYGRLLIIDHGEGYHTLLAGFSRIDSIQGQWLLAGEPVGVMGRGLTEYKTLYVEFRHDGVAINPLPWLAASETKADG